jgi:lipoprotein-anchoring transpeptidase ErfK/SrfK
MTIFRNIAVVLAVAASVAFLCDVGPAAALTIPTTYPAAGELRVPNVAARAAPDPHARVVASVRQFRPDFRRQIVFAVTERTGADGRPWYKLSLSMRPNGTMGWVPARAVSVSPTHNRIVVNRGTRRLLIYSSDKLVYKAIVAVGAPGRETPLGNFYVTARFVPDDPFLGVFAVETSAYSYLTEWPGGGVVGIHGTSRPELLGQAVSHGCVRVSNASALVLKRYALLGTPIRIIR